MRILAVLAVAAVLAWSGYWFVGERALNHAITTGLAAAPEIEVADYSIYGFPNRFDVTFDQPRITANGVQWSAPFVQVFALSYRLTHLIAVFAHDQTVSIGGQDALLHSGDLRASLVVAPGFDLPLERFTLVGEQLDLSTAGQSLRADALHAASRRISEREHELVVVLNTAFPDPGAMDRADPNRNWPRWFDELRLGAQVEFDRTVDRHVIDGPEPQLVRLTLTDAHAAWEGTEITATGRLTPNNEGLLSGDVSLTVTGWQALMQAVRASGLIPTEHDELITRAMQGLVNADDPNRIDAAFAVTDGAVYLGPILFGQIPALY